MDTLILFITIIAWVIGVGTTLFTILRIIAYNSYTDLDRALDGIKGVKASFPVTGLLITATVCWAWIIAQHLG